jgi:hypothetical protein
MGFIIPSSRIAMGRDVSFDRRSRKYRFRDLQLIFDFDVLQMGALFMFYCNR